MRQTPDCFASLWNLEPGLEIAPAVRQRVTPHCWSLHRRRSWRVASALDATHGRGLNQPERPRAPRSPRCHPLWMATATSLGLPGVYRRSVRVQGLTLSCQFAKCESKIYPPYWWYGGGFVSVGVVASCRGDGARRCAGLAALKRHAAMDEPMRARGENSPLGCRRRGSAGKSPAAADGNRLS